MGFTTSTSNPAAVVEGDDLKAARRVVRQMIASRAFCLLDDEDTFDIIVELRARAGVARVIGNPDDPLEFEDFPGYFGRLNAEQVETLRWAARWEAIYANDIVSGGPWGDDPADPDGVEWEATGRRRAEDARRVLVASATSSWSESAKATLGRVLDRMTTAPRRIVGFAHEDIAAGQPSGAL
jgi:hypothetical protein